MNKIEALNKLYDIQVCIMNILSKYDSSVNIANYRSKTSKVLRENDITTNDSLKLEYYGNKTKKLCSEIRSILESEEAENGS